MKYPEVVAGVLKSISVDDLNGLTVHREGEKLTLVDDEDRRWVLLLAEALPEPDHTPEECPDRIEKPEYTIPAQVFHGLRCRPGSLEE